MDEVVVRFLCFGGGVVRDALYVAGVDKLLRAMFGDDDGPP